MTTTLTGKDADKFLKKMLRKEKSKLTKKEKKIAKGLKDIERIKSK